MKGKRTWKIAVLSLSLVCAVSGCARESRRVLDPKKPTVITVWHAYNAVAKAQFDELVMEFNETVGMEQGLLWMQWVMVPAKSWKTCFMHLPTM